MNIDGYTLYMIFIVSSWTGVFVIGFLWFTNRHTKGVKYWFYAQLSYSLAVPLALTRLTLGEEVGIILANIVYLIAVLFFIAGHIEFLLLNHPTWFYSLLCGVFVGIFGYYYFIEFNTNARSHLMSLIAISVATYIGGLYFRAWKVEKIPAYLFAFITFMFSATINLFSILSILNETQTILFERIANQPILHILIFISQLIQLFVNYVLVNSIHIKKLNHLASFDSLTESYNRRSFIELSDRMLQRARKSDVPVSLLMIDVDWFKLVNDNYGHSSGDEVLRKLVQNIKKEIRPTDFVGRYGGEEFCVLLHSTKLETAIDVAERIRKRVAECKVTAGNSELSITISTGVACFNHQNNNLEKMLQSADKALYKAKDLGRNKVCSYTDKSKD